LVEHYHQLLLVRSVYFLKEKGFAFDTTLSPLVVCDLDCCVGSSEMICTHVMVDRLLYEKFQQYVKAYFYYCRDDRTLRINVGNSSLGTTFDYIYDFRDVLLDCCDLVSLFITLKGSKSIMCLLDAFYVCMFYDSCVKKDHNSGECLVLLTRKDKKRTMFLILRGIIILQDLRNLFKCLGHYP